jgi:hypothetical protein
MEPQKVKRPVKNIKDLMASNAWLDRLDKSTKYVTTEHQTFGLILAQKLNDKRRLPMYIRLAKEEYRPLLEKALSFVSDYPKAKSKSALFMWKLKELRKEREEKEKARENLEATVNLL